MRDIKRCPSKSCPVLASSTLGTLACTLLPHSETQPLPVATFANAQNNNAQNNANDPQQAIMQAHTNAAREALVAGLGADY